MTEAGILGLARLCESAGAEISVRLIVGGVPIAGLLTSTMNFKWWAERLMNMGLATGSPLPYDVTAPRPTKEEYEEIANE